MKRKTLAKFAAAALAAVTVFSTAMPAFAGTSYDTEIDGTKTANFTKYLVMDADANVPNATFTYTITAGTAVAKTESQQEVLAGVDAEKVTVGSVTFAPGDTTKQDENSKVKNYNKETQKYAEKTATLDFSNCAFTEPGIYRYILTENASTNTAITNDSATTRVVDVYVQDNTDDSAKKLKVAGIVLHKDATDMDSAKSEGFTNKYGTANITVGNDVSGNQGSHDKYFKYTIEITDATPGTKYTIDLNNADGTVPNNAATKSEYVGQTNPTEVTVDKDGKTTITVYLQDKQEITINGVSKGTKYNVTVDGEDYTTSKTESRPSETSGTIDATDIDTGYTANREGTIPTGVIMTVAPFAIIALIGVLGAVLILGRRKKNAGM